MKITDIGTGKIVSVERTERGWLASVHHDGDTPAMHHTYEISEEQARQMSGMTLHLVWVGSRVSVSKVENGGSTPYVFSRIADMATAQPPGEIAKLRKEWAEMRKELDARTEAAQGPLLEKLRRAENDVASLRVLLRDRDAALEAVKKALQVRS